MMTSVPMNQPCQLLAGLTNAGAIFASSTIGDRYGRTSPSVARGSWNSTEPPMNTSAFGAAFSERMRVARVPAAGMRITSVAIFVSSVNSLVSALVVFSSSAA